MRPVRTARSNFVWTGPTPDRAGDLHSEIDRANNRNRTMSVWEPTPEERQSIASGGNIKLTVYGVHPPVALNVTSEQGVGEDAPEIHDRLEEWRATQAEPRS